MHFIAMSPRVVSKPETLQNHATDGGDIYQVKCLRGRLLVFVEGICCHDGYMFWPGLAAAHFDRNSADIETPTLKGQGGAPNFAKLRPIKQF